MENSNIEDTILNTGINRGEGIKELKCIIPPKPREPMRYDSILNYKDDIKNVGLVIGLLISTTFITAIIIYSIFKITKTEDSFKKTIKGVKFYGIIYCIIALLYIIYYYITI